MKILILHKALIIGGVEKTLLNLLKLLNKIDVKVDVFLTYQVPEQGTFQKGNNNKTQFFYNLDCISYEKYKISERNRKCNVIKKLQHAFLKAKHNFIYNNNLMNILSRNNYDLIIDYSGCLDKPIRNPFIYNKLPPTIRWIHGQLNGEKIITEKQKRKYQKIFSKHKRVICICEQMTHLVQDLFPLLPKDKFQTLYNPIDITEIQERAKDKLEVSINHPYILQVSRLVVGKGHEELLEIYASLKKRGFRHKLYFIGDGENRKNLTNQIKKLGLEQDCFLLGAYQNPYPYFKHADLFVHTSKHEGLPTVLLESMACGIPVVAMDCLTGPKDILGENSQYGKLISMHNKEDFIEAVIELINNKEIYDYYSSQSIKRVNDFSSENAEVKLLSLIKEITKDNL